MIDIHPPAHAAHTWRDFFIHIATIVIGLLIAIGLEQALEWNHHRHLVGVARRDLHHEIVANIRTLDLDDQNLYRVRAELLSDLSNLRGIQAGHAPVNATLTANWAWQPLRGAAFTTARDTGVFAFMPYDEVQEYDMLYLQEQYVHDAAATYIESVNQIREPLQGGRALADLSADEREKVIDHTSQALLNIDLLRSMMATLRNDYERLPKHATE